MPRHLCLRKNTLFPSHLFPSGGLSAHHLVTRAQPVYHHLQPALVHTRRTHHQPVQKYEHCDVSRVAPTHHPHPSTLQLEPQSRQPHIRVPQPPTANGGSEASTVLINCAASSSHSHSFPFHSSICPACCFDSIPN